jgi:hypothetical protein
MLTQGFRGHYGRRHNRMNDILAIRTGLSENKARSACPLSASRRLDPPGGFAHTGRAVMRELGLIAGLILLFILLLVAIRASIEVVT